MKQWNNQFFYLIALIVGAYFFIMGLVKAQAFFAPFATAIILSLVMLPLANRLERSSVKRIISSLICTISLLLISWAFIALISFQVKSFIEDWPKLKETMAPKVEQFKNYLVQQTPLQENDFAEMQLNQKDESGNKENNNIEEKVSNVLGQVFSFFGNYLLTFIYIFFLLNYRHHFKNFILQITSAENRKSVKKIINESIQVAPRYLVGRGIMIVILAGLYALGLGISGVGNFILISVLAALLSIIPYFGNIIGFAIAIVLGYVATGDTTTLIGIGLTFAIAQFVESYILEPYIVGDKVALHPFFVILAVIIGNLIWGVIGMILFIPILAILVVVMTHIPALRPLGELIGSKSKKS